MTLEKTIMDLKKGKVAPCYLLYGEEEYLINETLHQILDIIVPQSDRDFGLFFLDGENADFDILKDHLLAPSLLGGRKVVVVKNTTIFQSRENLGDLIQKIRDNLNEHPDKAAKYFLTFLKISGFAWEDMQGSGWQKITDEQWRKAVEEDSGDDRNKWLPRIIEICTGRGWASGSVADPSEQFEELLAQGLPTGNCLIMTAEAVDKRKKIFKVIDKAGIALHFGEIKGEAATRETLKLEAQKLLDRCGRKLTPAAWIALGKKTGFQLRPSLNELQKLISFVGERAVIEEKDVEAVVGKTKEDSIFDLTTALAEKNATAALLALKGLLDQGTHHLMILTMISREIRMLLQASVLVRSGKLPRITPSMEYGSFQKNVYPAVLGLAPDASRKEDLLVNKHPFVIYNALKHCSRFSYPVLLNYLDDLLKMDRAMKSSATDPQLLLERFLIKACVKT
ncbi:MAG: DNA polymerase III subunit delta [Deltaproteobacteria bacterium HGW-Deltaproteobacteria-7]|jgi:DNA polymerase-3 subunit delta|nr:MAG: DNA polymerase III subunit delta [Deltaproteobacteria bacterium HGW-Deltaproteobacteria-7]PKN18362.1 MAG: DNA polymerase III subunit delta [Deltaproteobacteria bacterium HGW-Deltaproteobacteria-6]